MDDDSLSICDSPGDLVDDTMDQQAINLQSYVQSLPYECETQAVMLSRLEWIVSQISICAESQNWLVLTTWDNALNCWLLMKYPMPSSTRAKLVRLYFELCITPGIESRVIRSWADMLNRLISHKPGMKHILGLEDLQLPWKPLWKALESHLWHKGKVHDSSRSIISLLLYVAEKSNYYFARNDIAQMLNGFIPLLTRETYPVILPVITSFLPPSHTHLYLPTLFSFWEAINSSLVDDRLMHLAGQLSEDHVSGSIKGPGGAEWQDIGIWKQAQWDILVTKGLGSMNVPVGATRGASTTANHADTLGDKHGYKVKKAVDRLHSLAKILVYSMSVDGIARVAPQSARSLASSSSFAGGSKALDTLERLMTSTESFFHPSNSGQWSLSLTTFLHRVVMEFSKRLMQEEKADCQTPITQRITHGITREFVIILRTPALLSLFSKDPLCVGFAQGALRGMAMLAPSLIMPDLLERAYGGLEVVNETHRTTSVLTMLSGIARPLVTESIWLGGQKHLLPLLELCLPGIDLNDPSKTVCTTMFVVSAIQHVKIGDLSMHHSGHPLTDDIPDEMLQVDDDTRLPDGTESATPVLSRVDERALARDSTALFADWVAALFRRVIALYENLPEEGGRRNTTGGKQEESVLKSVKAMMDVVCLHLSDQLFDMILNMAFDYASTNAKSNAVRAFGQLIACLARVRPHQTLAKFLPFCMNQVEEELRHGASSIRTTAPTSAVPSDTTFHWNLAILRGCLGYGGPLVLKYKEQILWLMDILIDKSMSERGYTGAGRLLGRLLHTLTGVYPVNSRFVNRNQWVNEDFERDHNLHWGHLYTTQEVDVEWHVPSSEEIAFALELLDKINAPLLDKIEELVSRTSSWDGTDRNDFCRYLNTCRSMWGGLSTFILEQPKTVSNPALNEDTECPDLLVSFLPMNAGFALSDPSDPRYIKASAHRLRFGQICRDAASALRQRTNGEDHIDAVLNVVKSIDSYLLDYAMSKDSFESVQKNYSQARDTTRIWNGQKENTRSTFVKRAQMYHCSRVYMHALYRRRSGLDDELIREVLELSLSPYTRVRRQSQAVLHNIFGYYVRSTRSTLPSLFDALARGTDPDRMKGALYILWNKGIASYALSDQNAYGRYLVSLLECQHEEKPSIQKLVGSLASDCLPRLHEDAVHTDAYSLSTPRIVDALRDLESEFTKSFVNKRLLQEAKAKSSRRVQKRNELHTETVASILEIVSRPHTHWRYVYMACRFLVSLMRRDVPATADIAHFFLRGSLSPQPTIAVEAQRGVTLMLKFVNLRSFSTSSSDLWLHAWTNPLSAEVPVTNPSTFLNLFENSVSSNGVYFDKIRTGFIAWTPTISGYRAIGDDIPPFKWDDQSAGSLNTVAEVISARSYFEELLGLWSQESARTSSLELRLDHVAFIKRLAKMFSLEALTPLFDIADSLLSDPDKYKQRAGGEVLTGLVRGSKHWTKTPRTKLWTWVSGRLNTIFTEIKPETLTFWETAIAHMLEDRDPRRNKPLVDWILSLSLEFNGDSAFQMSKALSTFATLVDSADLALGRKTDGYIDAFLANANTTYAEIRLLITQNLCSLVYLQWNPVYDSVESFLKACSDARDPLCIRTARHQPKIRKIIGELKVWREQRLAPPWSNKSEYDKVSLTLLQWIWVSSYGPNAASVLPYMVDLLPEIFRMAEFNDNTELQTYSTAVLYVLSAFTPPAEYILMILNSFVSAIKSANSWRIRLVGLPALVVFFYRNLLSIDAQGISSVMDMLLTCLSDENVEVRETASKALSGIVRCSQRQSIIPLKNRFITTVRKTKLPDRKDPCYNEALRTLHSAILGLCALIESFPYSVESWMPHLTEVLAPHTTDPVPVSTTIRKCASEFKKTHQDTWHKDQLAFNEDQLQSLSTMLVGTSYYA